MYIYYYYLFIYLGYMAPVDQFLDELLVLFVFKKFI
jgi:hypothetical protein